MNSSFHFEAHKNYIRGIDEAACHYHSELVEYDDLCLYTQHNEACRQSVYLIHYTEFLFCTLLDGESNAVSLGMILCFMAGLLYFCMLSALALVTVPNVMSVTKKLRLNEHSAGVTIGVTSLVSSGVMSLYYLHKSDTEMGIAQNLGTSMYLRALHGGIIICLRPMILYRLYYLRDALILAFALVCTHIVVEKGKTNIFEGILLMLFYPSLCYIVYVQNAATQEGRIRAAANEILTPERKLFLFLTKEIEIIQVPTLAGDPLTFTLFKQFKYVVNPLRPEIYQDSAGWQRLILKALYPLVVLSKLFVPVVDLRMPGDGYSKLLIIINILLAPIILIPFFNYELLIVFSAIAIIMAVLASFKLEVESPSHQLAIALFGCCLQALLVNLISGEFVSVNVAIGNILHIQRGVIGPTFSTFASSWDEIITYLTLLRWNVSTFPLAQYLVSPICGLVFFLGATILVNSIVQQSIYVVIRGGDLGPNGLWFCHIHNTFLTMYIVMADYQARKSLGIFSIIIFVLYLTYLILAEYDIIHGYGTDHDYEELVNVVDWA